MKARRIGPALPAIAVLLALAIAPSSATAAQPACGDVITKDVTLARDLTNCPGDGLVIGADGVTVDLNGHSVAGSGAGRGIANPGYDRATVRDGSISDFTDGVSSQDSSRQRFTGLDVRAGDVGVVVNGGGRNRIAGNTLTGSLRGVSVVGSSRNGVVHNDLVAIAFTGVGLASAHRNRVADNAVAADPAVTLTGSNHNVIANNGLDGSNSGIRLSGSSRNRVAGNSARSRILPVGGFSILAGSDRNRIVRNSFGTGRTSDGFTLADSDGNLLRGNAVTGGDAGVSVTDTADRTRLLDNQASGALDDGIRVDSATSTLRGNIATDNLDLGIQAVDGVTDGGGNRASGNGNPAQCTGVVCSP